MEASLVERERRTPSSGDEGVQQRLRVFLAPRNQGGVLTQPGKLGRAQSGIGGHPRQRWTRGHPRAVVDRAEHAHLLQA